MSARPPGLVTALLLIVLVALTGCGRAAGLVADTPTAPAAPATNTPARPAALGTPSAPAGAGPTETVGAGATPTVRPTPADPLTIFEPLALIDPSTGAVIEKSDFLELDGKAPKEALLTVSLPPVISGTNALPLANLSYTDTMSALAVVGYDPVAVRWKIIYNTPGTGIPGRALPLPATAQGQNLLGMNPPLPVLQLRSAITPTAGSSVPAISLHLFAWKDGTVKPLPMRPAGAGADQDAAFTGAADVQLLDLDNDGRAEVLVDDGTRTTIWKWDGTRFVPR